MCDIYRYVWLLYSIFNTDWSFCYAPMKGRLHLILELSVFILDFSTFSGIIRAETVERSSVPTVVMPRFMISLFHLVSPWFWGPKNLIAFRFLWQKLNIFIDYCFTWKTHLDIYWKLSPKVSNRVQTQWFPWGKVVTKPKQTSYIDTKSTKAPV